MSWFDKRSWRLKRKIKDLQAELREAEEQGKFIVEEGIFFAELEDMGDQTMMAFGTDLLASAEESVIRTFLDRNGFTVDRLKLDPARTGLADVEILPPEEMTRSVARHLKGDGYKLVDDSEKELAPNLPAKILTLSALMRAMTYLFLEQVHHVIANTRVKNNKEGNRLLHWLPKIMEFLENKVDMFTIDIIRPGFEAGYEEFYGQVGKPATSRPAPVPPPSSQTRQPERIPSVQFPMKTPGGSEVKSEKTPETRPDPKPEPRTGAADPLRGPIPIPIPSAPIAPSPAPAPPPPQRPVAPPPPPVSASAPVSVPPSSGTAMAASARPQADSRELKRLERARATAETLAHMYKSLVKANASRCVRNCEPLLEEIRSLYRATATCLLVKVPQGHGLTIHAQAGKKLQWGDGGGEGFPISSTVINDCIHKQAVVSTVSGGGDPSTSMVIHNIESAAAAPVNIRGDVAAILYVDRREGAGIFDKDDCALLELLVQPFEDFPDLTLGLVED